MKEMLLDANVLVRFLVQDDPRQGPSATALLEKAERNEVRLHLDGLAVAETVYVLMGRYGKKRADIANTLLSLLEANGIETSERAVVTDALRRFGMTNVDFSDAWLAARAGLAGMPVASFDRDFEKFKDIRRVEPG